MPPCTLRSTFLALIAGVLEHLSIAHGRGRECRHTVLFQPPADLIKMSQAQLIPKSRVDSIRQPTFLSRSYAAAEGLGLGLEFDLDHIYRREPHPSSFASWDISTFQAGHLLTPGLIPELVPVKASPKPKAPPRKTVVREAWRASRAESKVMQGLILRVQDSPYEMLNLLLTNSGRCNHVNLVTVLHRIGKAHVHLSANLRESLTDSLLPVFSTLLQSFSARHLCNIAWSLSRLNLADHPLFKQTITLLSNPVLLRSCNPGEIAMAMWAVASSGLTSDLSHFFEVSAEPIRAKSAALKPREIGVISWAYATWYQPHAQQLARKARSGELSEEEQDKEQEDSARLTETLIAIVHSALYCESQFTARDIAMIAWSFGRLAPLAWNKMSSHLDMLCTVLASAAQRKIRQFSAHDLAELSVALVALQYDNAHLMQMIAYAATAHLRHFSHRELSNIVWAFGKLYRRPQRFVLAVVAEANQRLPYFSPAELANIAWALTVLEVYDGELFRRIFSTMDQRHRDLAEGELNQLYQVYVMLRIEIPEVLSTVVGPELGQAMAQAWARSKRREKRTTRRQAAVSRILDELGIEHQVEAEHDIDILLPERNIALEIDGPAHFLRRTGHPMGHTMMKRRLLQKLGYDVISIPHFEWDKIPYWSSTELRRYLARRCQTDVNPVWKQPSLPVTPLKKTTRFD